ncbi:MAG TPA: hypothetical protein VJC07_03095 [Candidatus Nanoarchaeia archaeon]|nr:hypothetical protein [Candidatus Nanoarchaeia archaeon]
MIEGELVRDIFLIIHILGAMLGIGSATIADYLHLKSLKNHRLERTLLGIYPLLSGLIIAGLLVLVASGFILVWMKPELLQSSLFRLKMFLVLVLMVNGYFLRTYVYPHFKKDVLHNHPKEDARSLMYSSSITGSISIVSWYTIFILASTKSYGYSVSSVLNVYITAIILVFLVSIFLEKRSHWNKLK